MTRNDAEQFIGAVAILLAPLAAVGLALLQTGFGRGRAAAHALLGTMCAFGAATLAYLFCGNALAGLSQAHWQLAILLRGKSWSLVGGGALAMSNLDGGAASWTAAFGLLLAGLTAIIPLGACSERLRLKPLLLLSALLGGLAFPLLAHWIWGGGWLAQLGALDHCGRGALDIGGAAAVHTLGGLAALSLCWRLGPRQGKYDAGGMALPAHNVVLLLTGCLLSVVGWTAIDAGGALLLAGATLDVIPHLVINTVVATATALLASLLVTAARYGKPDASMGGNAFVAGAVSMAAGGAFMNPLTAAFTGLIAGLVVPFTVEWLDRLGVDDPSGVISMHAVGGLWSLLAAGLFGGNGQWLAQIATISALLGFALPLNYGLDLVLNLLCPLRTTPEDERLGLDMAELGSGAYPELPRAENNLSPR